MAGNEIAQLAAVIKLKTESKDKLKPLLELVKANYRDWETDRKSVV